MDFIKVEESNVNTLYDLNFQLAVDENQKSLFTASRNSYSSAFLGNHPISFGFLGFIGKKPVGFYIFCFKFASYLGSKVLYIEDVYLDKEFRTSDNTIMILNHAIQQSTLENCARVEMRVLKSFNIGYDIINQFGFNQIKKWNIYRFEQECK